MPEHPRPYNRRSIRLPGYDYRMPGAYFITICTYQRERLFEDTEYYDVAVQQWTASAAMRAEVSLDSFVVMPNHIHGIVWIAARAQGLAPLQQTFVSNIAPRSLGAFVRGYKSAVTREVNALRGTPDIPVWQRNYYEHIIRNDSELNRIRQYIVDNPLRWAFDRDNVTGTPDREEIDFWESLA